LDGGGALADAGSPSPVDAGIAPTGDAGPPTDVGAPAGEGVDLLFVVDNSNSMRDSQQRLAEQVEALMGALVAPPVDPATGRPVAPPVRRLHVGVVSSDLGTPGSVVPSCANRDVGDDGLLNPIPNGQAMRTHQPWTTAPPGIRPARCMNNPQQYPNFLSFDAMSTDAATIREDLVCNAFLSVGGCGLEQPLESAYRALVVRNPRAQPGNADPNGGFVRDGAVLGIVVLTDEDDGSVRDCRRHDGVGPCDDARDVYQPASTRWSSPDLNLRLYDFAPGSAQDPTWPLERYVDPARPARGLLGLKPGHPERIVFGAITGVPTAMPRTADGNTDWDALLGPAPAGRPDDFAARDERLAYAASGAPEGPVSMRQRELDPACPQRLLPACRQAQTAPSCSLTAQPIAWRARRIAEVARRFDASALCAGGPCRNGMVTSLCAHNDPTPFQRFAEMIARRVQP